MGRVLLGVVWGEGMSETEIIRPVDNCGHVNPLDGLCAHPMATTPECHCAFAEPRPCGRGCAACPTEEP